MLKEKMKYVIEYLATAIVFLFIEIVTIFFPVYIAYVQKFGVKARSIVYGYWLIHRKDRFKNFLFEMAGDVISIYFFLDPRLLAFDVELSKYNGKIKKTFYIGNYGQLEVPIKRVRIWNYIRYQWYYWMVWVWLDDVNSVNALDKRVLLMYRDNDDLGAPINWVTEAESDIDFQGRLKYLTGITICNDVFDKDYYLGKYPLPSFYKRLWGLKYQYINNFVRDRCVKTTKATRAFLKNRFGFVYNHDIKKSCLTLFGYNVVRRGVCKRAR